MVIAIICTAAGWLLGGGIGAATGLLVGVLLDDVLQSRGLP